MHYWFALKACRQGCLHSTETKSIVPINNKAYTIKFRYSLYQTMKRY